MQTIYTSKTVSVTELKRNYSSVLAHAKDDPVAILNHNRPEAYFLSAAQYVQLLERIEELEDKLLVQERAAGPYVTVDFHEL